MCTYFVIPGVAPTLQDRDRFRLLIKLLFPTLGKPTLKGKVAVIRIHARFD